MSDSTSESSKSLRTKKVVIPKVWKRPHSTIYGKNVEFGSKLYSDKLGEINGRKFNSELPWQVRNSGVSSSSTSSSGSHGYISSLLLTPESTLLGSVLSGGGGGYYAGSTNLTPTTQRPFSCSAPSQIDCNNYAELLELTNPSLYSARARRAQAARAKAKQSTASKQPRIDFYAQYLDSFNRDVRQMGEQSILLHEPLLHRRAFDKYLDFNHEIGVFVPSQPSSGGASSSLSDRFSSSSSNRFSGGGASCLGAHEFCPPSDGRSLIYKKTLDVNRSSQPAAAAVDHSLDHVINNSFTPVCTTTQQTALLPKHACQLASSPYGQSADGRKLSLGSINPHSYRPSLPSKSSTVHASDGEEFEFQDRSSPFYTDRWAGKTIRHFDSDLYSNANLFKSMIL